MQFSFKLLPLDLETVSQKWINFSTVLRPRADVSYHMEVAVATQIELTLHHIEENGDGGFPELHFRGQSDFQNGTHHGWDEFDFVRPWDESKWGY